jgi:hypothetical protein
MPRQEICEKTNDPCDPKLFDENILGIAAGPPNQFALIVRQSGRHATAQGEPTLSVASQAVLYLYLLGAHGWLYCEDEMSDAEATMRTRASLRSWQFQDNEGRCTPTLPVVPDKATAIMSPFSEGRALSINEFRVPVVAPPIRK